jgi:hypothetical protein
MPRAMHRRCCCPLVHASARQVLEQAHAEGYVVVDRHREGRGLLEHHADARADEGNVLARGKHVLLAHQDLAFGALLGIELEHAVERAQQR